MMVDDNELEPVPASAVPRKSRQPEPPLRVPQVLRSYHEGDKPGEGKKFKIRKPTEVEALAVKSEIIAAVYYLQRWGLDVDGVHREYDVRVRPYVTEHYVVKGNEYDAKNLFEVGTELAADHFWKDGTEYYVLDGHYCEADDLVQAVIDMATDHYWLVIFQVHDPQPRGLRQMSPEQRDKAHRRSAEARGIKNFKGSGGGRHEKPKQGRNVQKRADD